MKLNASPMKVFGGNFLTPVDPNHYDKDGNYWYWIYDEDSGILYQSTDIKICGDEGSNPLDDWYL